jgi:hypothetical protein
MVGCHLRESIHCIFQKRVVVTKFDIYVFITITAGGLLVPESIIRQVVSAVGPLVPEGIIRQVVIASTLTWFIINIHY